MTPADRLRLRDALLEALRVRAGHELTEMVIQDRANNGVAYLEPVVDDIVTAALKDAARGEVVVGTIGAQPSEPTCTMCGGAGKLPVLDFDEDSAPYASGSSPCPGCTEPIGVVRAPRQNPGDGETAQEHAERVIK